MIFLLFSLFISKDFSADVASLELYRPEMATVWQWQENYLFCEYNPPRLVKVSPSGEVLASFSEQGAGPEEINRPVIFGFDEAHLFVISNGHRIQVFDHQLRLTDTSLPPLHSVVGSNIIWQGLKMDDGSFVLIYGSTGLHHSHGMIHVALDGNKWQILDRYFPFDIAEKNQNLPMPNAKNPKWQLAASTMVKMTPTVLQTEDTYEVILYPKPWQSEKQSLPIGGIFSDVEGISSNDKHFRCFPDRVGILEDGFVVQIFFDRGEIAHDYFDAEGGFIRRDFDDYHIIPVTNTDKTLKLVLNDESEHLYLMN